MHVQRAARALARRFDDALRPVGLTNGQFSLLISLNRPVPPPMKPVAELLAMDQTTLTAALKPLQRQGWVEIIVNPDDRRERLLQLTPEGKAILAAAVPIWKATHLDIEKQLVNGNGDEVRRNLLVMSSV
ncbi:MarR family transcriptional regulator [Ochrobactrum sp. EGD-AQ16]|nr:MarR family transcriptional regulator [Ochrobactrum sp. EGD-AQ16]